MSESRTPGPITCESDPYPDGTPYFIFKAGAGNHQVEGGGFHITAIMLPADAEHLVRSYNAHDDLVKALTSARDALKRRGNGDAGRPDINGGEWLGLMDEIDAALAKAKGETP